jgi:hypothetical protein
MMHGAIANIQEPALVKYLQHIQLFKNAGPPRAAGGGSGGRCHVCNLMKLFMEI